MKFLVEKTSKEGARLGKLTLRRDTGMVVETPMSMLYTIVGMLVGMLNHSWPLPLIMWKVILLFTCSLNMSLVSLLTLFQAVLQTYQEIYSIKLQMFPKSLTSPCQLCK